MRQSIAVSKENTKHFCIPFLYNTAQLSPVCTQENCNYRNIKCITSFKTKINSQNYTPCSHVHKHSNHTKPECHFYDHQKHSLKWSMQKPVLRAYTTDGDVTVDRRRDRMNRREFKPVFFGERCRGKQIWQRSVRFSTSHFGKLFIKTSTFRKHFLLSKKR